MRAPRSGSRDIVITGFGIAVPGLEDVLAGSPTPGATFEPAAKLGRKGLRFKDQATQLALCAAHDALAHAGAAADGVVVSSNFGNLDTVCRMARTVHAGRSHDLSPMDGPNASSNVIAGAIAIRFGCRGINQMVCNGATSGTDAIYLAAVAIAAGRAHRVAVVGVEPSNEVVRALAGEVALGSGAACVILEDGAGAAARRAPIHGRVAPQGGPFSVEDALPRLVAAVRPAGTMWLTPNRAWPRNRHLVDEVRRKAERVDDDLDLSDQLGEVHGALGVLQCVAACTYLRANPACSAVVATSGGAWDDDLASVLVTRGSQSP